MVLGTKRKIYIPMRMIKERLKQWLMYKWSRCQPILFKVILVFCASFLQRHLSYTSSGPKARDLNFEGTVQDLFTFFPFSPSFSFAETSDCKQAVTPYSILPLSSPPPFLLFFLFTRKRSTIHAILHFILPFFLLPRNLTLIIIRTQRLCTSFSFVPSPSLFSFFFLPLQKYQTVHTRRFCTPSLLFTFPSRLSLYSSLLAPVTFFALTPGYSFSAAQHALGFKEQIHSPFFLPRSESNQPANNTGIHTSQLVHVFLVIQRTRL